MYLRPFDAIMLDCGDGHWLYVEQVGTKGATPALFLHGGPGGGAQHSHRNLFDPNRFHAFLFDQRGAGRSHPYLSRNANTTDHQIADIERIRTFYGIERWLIVGGSWGSTLALAYAQAHPERVAGLVLRAVFLGTDDEVAWAFELGPKQFRPDLYGAFRDALPEAERNDPLQSYIKRLLDPDPAIHRPAAEIWHNYERALSELAPSNAQIDTVSPDRDTPTKPTPILEAHYIRNRFFLAPNQLRDGMAALNDIPGVIIQGRYDLLCPPSSSFEIAKRWPKCRLQFVESAGHAMSDAGVTEAMRGAVAEVSGAS